MKTFKIILKNGFVNCCNIYSTGQLRQFTRYWFKDRPDIKLSIIDITEDYWESDDLADWAYENFKNEIFPLTYLDDQLVMMGNFPDGKELSEMLENPKPITEQMIQNAISIKNKAKQ